jgi:hypothetical protein
MDPVKLKAVVRDDTWRSCSARSKNPAAVDALHGLFDLIIETLADRIDDVKAENGKAISFLSGGREILTINVGRKDLRIYVHPAAGALFDPKMRPKVERFRFWDGSYQKSSGMYRAMSFWISDVKYLKGAREIIRGIPKPTK